MEQANKMRAKATKAVAAQQMIAAEKLLRPGGGASER